MTCMCVRACVRACVCVFVCVRVRVRVRVRARASARDVWALAVPPPSFLPASFSPISLDLVSESYARSLPSCACSRAPACRNSQSRAGRGQRGAVV